MPVDQDNQDLIKRVTEATLKAISARDDVEVTFAPGAHGISNTPEGNRNILYSYEFFLELLITL